MDGQKAAATLGVDPQANKDEIRRAFRARVKLAHPDAPGAEGSSEEFLQLRAAFEALLAGVDADVDVDVGVDVGVDVDRDADVDGRSERPVATEPSSSQGLWQTQMSNTSRSTFVLTDFRRPAPRMTGRPVKAGGLEPAAPTRDKKGLSFDDHLAAALAG